MSEQQTCRTFVVPALRASGWDKRQIREQYRITNGKIIASARRHRPGNPLVADYVLEYRDDVPLAVVEAKRTKVNAAAGIEQAKRYAQQLELPVAYATNGHEIWEIEIGGAIRQRPDFLPRMSCGSGSVKAKVSSRSWRGRCCSLPSTRRCATTIWSASASATTSASRSIVPCGASPAGSAASC